MDELRSEIRAAFEKEQAIHPPARDLRDNLVDAVSAHRRPARNFQWLAVAAALIIAVLVVIGLMSTRFHPRASVPAATPNASPVADYGPPPAGVPLLYVNDPSHKSWLIGFDWTGMPRGTVKLGPAVDGGQYVGMAPDGQTFQVSPTAKGGSGVFLDRLGQLVPALGSTGNYSGGVWADDNRHFCSVSFDQQTYEWTLVTQLPGEGQKQVAVIARDTEIGQNGISVAACSYQNDQAILVRTVISSPSELWVMKLSNGAILSHRALPGLSATNIVASGDSTLMAVNSTIQPTSQPTAIVRVSDGTSVATLDATMSVLAFSGDDSLVLVTTGGWINNQPTHLALVNLRSGQILWRYNGTESLESFVAQPGGTGFAVALKAHNSQAAPTPCPSGSGTATCTFSPNDPLRDVVIVHGDGISTAIPGRYATAW